MPCRCQGSEVRVGRVVGVQGRFVEQNLWMNITFNLQEVDTSAARTHSVTALVGRWRQHTDSGKEKNPECVQGAEEHRFCQTHCGIIGKAEGSQKKTKQNTAAGQAVK